MKFMKGMRDLGQFGISQAQEVSPTASADEAVAGLADGPQSGSARLSTPSTKPGWSDPTCSFSSI